MDIIHYNVSKFLYFIVAVQLLPCYCCYTVPEGKNGNRPVWFMASGVLKGFSPKVIPEEVAGLLCWNNIFIPHNCKEIIMNKVPIKAICIKSNWQDYDEKEVLSMKMILFLDLRISSPRSKLRNSSSRGDRWPATVSIVLWFLPQV